MTGLQEPCHPRHLLPSFLCMPCSTHQVMKQPHPMHTCMPIKDDNHRPTTTIHSSSSSTASSIKSTLVASPPLNRVQGPSHWPKHQSMRTWQGFITVSQPTYLTPTSGSSCNLAAMATGMRGCCRQAVHKG